MNALADMENFEDICIDANMFAIFECDAVFFGLLGFKPIELFIFTSKGLRIVADDQLEFNIPMVHIEQVQANFWSPAESVIVVSLTQQFAEYIEKSFDAIKRIELLSDGRNFTSGKITMICKKLEKSTKNVLGILFPHLSDIDFQTSDIILRRLCNVENNLTMYSEYSLNELNSPSLPEEQNALNGSSKYSLTEPDKTAQLIKITEVLNTSPVKNDNNIPAPTVSTNISRDECAIAGTKFETSDLEGAAKETDSDATMQPYNNNRTILTYQDDNGAVTLTFGDYMCLASKEFINDKIIDFYMKYIYNNVIRSNQERARTHIFSTYFYHVLTYKNRFQKKTDELTVAEIRHERVKSWTKDVNVFEKDFLIVPVNERSHWSVIVVCFANDLIRVYSDTFDSNNKGKGNDTIRQPAILLFNSMANTTNYQETRIIREYLTCEYNEKIPSANPPNFTKKTLPGHRMKVPQQNNLYDCGLYALQYVEEFFKNPIRDFRLPINQLEDWFDQMIIIRKREDIAKLIQRLMDENYQAIATSANIKLPNISFPTMNGGLVPEQFLDDGVPDECDNK